jgi:hypothetical protein
MKTAKSTDWKTEALPEKRTTIPLSRIFSAGEMDRIRQGLVPEEMEDKWFIYGAEDTLYFHRSWTGYCIYVVRFADEGRAWRMVEADVNRDPSQYNETDDESDLEMISYLIDVLLLRQDAVFPSHDASPENSALMNWSQVGRAMLGEHPGDEEVIDDACPPGTDEPNS